MRILYLTSSLPYQGSQEDFFLPEILEIIRAGHELLLVPRSTAGMGALKEIPKALRERSHACPLVSADVIFTMLCEILASPRRSLGILAHLLRSRSLRLLLHNLAVFPKALWTARLSRAWRAQHIHAQWATTPSTIAMIASRLTGIPWSLTTHRGDIVDNNLLAQKLISASAARFISESGIRLAESILGKPLPKAPRCIPMGVEYPPNPFPIHADWRKPVILCPASLVPVKGQEYLLSAMALLETQGLSCTLLLAGEGPLRSKLSTLTTELKIQNVRFLGQLPHPQLLQLYRQGKINITVLPSLQLEGGLQEGIPVSLLEAMAHGVPVVSTQSGGIPELLTGEAGLMVPPQCPGALADAILRIVQNPDLRSRLIAGGRRRIEERFDVIRVVPQLANLMGDGYQRVDHRPRPTGGIAAQVAYRNAATKLCTRCVMDSTVPGIRFDARGQCNYCNEYLKRAKSELFCHEGNKAALGRLADRIKRDGKGSEYDCLIGVSGGIDSSYAAYIAKNCLGLRPLAVHLDNGWNSELAVSNIERLLRYLKIDLYTHVLDWHEFRALQIAFLRASIANAEIPTDQAILAVLFKTAHQKGIKYIITGDNITTEAILPRSWMYDAKDTRLIHAISQRFSPIRLRSYPTIGPLQYLYYLLAKGMKYVRILNYVPYSKTEAKRILSEECGWRGYEVKHGESVYTRFFQSYLLPTKFRIDKRMAHLSTLIMSGQLTRDEALLELATPPSLEPEERMYALKKLGLSESECREILECPVRTFKSYPNSNSVLSALSLLVSAIKRKALGGQ